MFRCKSIFIEIDLFFVFRHRGNQFLNILSIEQIKMETEKLISFITRNQTFSEDSEVEDWLKQHEDNKEEYIRYKNLWALMQTGNNIPEDQILQGLNNVKNRAKQISSPSIFLRFLKYAAIIVFAFLGGYLINRVSSEEGAIVQNEIYVPNGNKTSLMLPDGTKVWLSNGTKFIYPQKFDGDTRTVELQGEGFFEVTHNRKSPFIVKLGEHRIKVLGTKFGVIAYPKDQTIKAELVSGEIQLDIKEDNRSDKFLSYFMKPSQSLLFNKISRKVTESKISDNFYNYWINGVYEFKDEALEDLAVKIERIYNIKIIIEDSSLKKRPFSGTLSINDNIFTLMEVFAKASGEPFSYIHEGNKIFIKKKTN